MDSIPRTRGDEPSLPRRSPKEEHVFPAHAGMNRLHEGSLYTKKRIPRTRGDEPGYERLFRNLDAYSPHTRG